MKRRFTIPLAFTCVMAVAFLFYAGCGKSNPIQPAGQSSSVSSKTVSDQPPGLAKLSKIRGVMAIQNKHTKNFMSKKGIVGTATGLDDNGEPIIMMFVKTDEDKKDIPAALDNVAVAVEVTGEFHALNQAAIPLAAKGAAAAVSHTAKQTPPIKLGTSGGWSNDLANGYCCGGTLGSLITDGAKQYILSNYHVFQADIVGGGNHDSAKAGDPIIQPGLVDVSCVASKAQTVATLSTHSFPASLPSSNVDASIAEVASGMVSATGYILEIGTISKSAVAAYINQRVKKSGRTSGLTRSYIKGLNAAISVTYDNECAGGTAFTKTFTGQIIISNQGSMFLRAGDSGSLLVEDAATNPRAVGLLYAGSNTLAVANPINEVLAHFGSSFTMVGQ